MNKVFFPVLAMLLALAMFSCENTFKGPVSELEYTEDGRLMVDLTIGGTGRALTADLARAGVDYYEVTFYDADGDKYYRAVWDYTRSGRIRVPIGTYDTSAKAILFAGRESDKTLLAVGIITNSDGGGSNAQITPTTTQVTFTLHPLLTDVKADITSTFRIMEPAPYATVSIGTNTFPTVLYGMNNVKIPLFKVPKAATGTVEAVFIISTNGLGAAASNFEVYAPGIYAVERTATASGIFNAGVSASDNGQPIKPLLISNSEISTPDPTGATMPNNGTIEISFDTPDDDGLSKIALALPVVAIDEDNTNSNPIRWYIRGGLENNLFDEGIESLTPSGGSILLGIGDINIIDIIVNGP